MGVKLENLDTGMVEDREELFDGATTVTFSPVASGIYRVTVRKRDDVDVRPVHDLADDTPASRLSSSPRDDGGRDDRR